MEDFIVDWGLIYDLFVTVLCFSAWTVFLVMNSSFLFLNDLWFVLSNLATLLQFFNLLPFSLPMNDLVYSLDYFK